MDSRTETNFIICNQVLELCFWYNFLLILTSLHSIQCTRFAKFSANFNRSGSVQRSIALRPCNVRCMWYPDAIVQRPPFEHCDSTQREWKPKSIVASWSWLQVGSRLAKVVAFGCYYLIASDLINYKLVYNIH